MHRTGQDGQNQIEVMAASPFRYGVYAEKEGLHVTAICHEKESGRERVDCGIVLYDRQHPDGRKIPFPEDCRVGNVASMFLRGYQESPFDYLFYSGDTLYQDPWARQLEKDTMYGRHEKKLLHCLVPTDTYDWQGDRCLHIPYEDSILYSLHVRGFTKHKSSGVRKKGTFAGIVEKKDYLRELGVSSLLLMPAYEFDELLPQARAQKQENSHKINFWGYQKGLYQVPKSSYAYEKDAVKEFKDMVRELHAAGFELLMQFYFPPEIRRVDILEILKYWVIEYHVDGFHVMGVDVPLAMLVQEPVLADTKIMIENSGMSGVAECGNRSAVGVFQDSFLYEMRKFLKGDDHMMNRFLYHIRNRDLDSGIINCIARWDGMRLADLVSYDRKHNESNGEENLDGTDYNCSWNCGVEGKSRKKSVLSLRLRQMQNAMSFVMLSQGTPLLYSGDEFGFSQDGNNNPYCQDNAISWINWNMTENGKELLAHTQKLTAIRRQHRVIRGKTVLPEQNAAGYPEISFHGREAWKPDLGGASRCVGIMFSEENFILYLAVNMHWEEHVLGLPQLPKGSVWLPLADEDAEKGEAQTAQHSHGKDWQEIKVPPRTAALYLARIEKKPDKAGRSSEKGKGKSRAKEGNTEHDQSVGTLQNHHTAQASGNAGLLSGRALQTGTSA